MANLLGQNIGTNYKGILNLNTLNGNLSGTLQAVTDGDGNSSPFQLSTTQASVNGQLSVLKDSGTLAYIGNTAGNSGFNFLFNQISAIGGNAFYISNTGSNIIFEVSSVERGRFTGANFVLGHTSASARLHVRGDGTNPIARFENNAGTLAISVSNSGQLTWAGGDYFELSTSGRNLYSANVLNFLGTWVNASNYVWTFSPINNVSATSGTHGFLNIGNTSFAAGAGSANFRPLNIAYTINNSGAQTGTATGIFLNATETALNGMTHNLIDLQRGGVSQFKVERDGVTSLPLIIITGGGANLVQLRPSSSGVLRLNNGDGTDFNRLQFGGTTNLFPALKRNGTILEVRRADDSGYSPLYAGDDSRILGTFRIQDSVGNNAMIMYGDGLSGIRTLWVNGSVGVGVLGNNASARLQVDSTTQGFLPPRGTNAQMLAIATPATGLVFYDTTNNKLNVYDGTNWVAMH